MNLSLSYLTHTHANTQTHTSNKQKNHLPWSMSPLPFTKKFFKIEENIHCFKKPIDLWDNIKCTHICIIEVPEEEREQGTKNLFEDIMT